MSLVEYTKLVIFILGMIFSPLQEEEVSGVYFDMVRLDGFIIESYVFEREGTQGRVAVFELNDRGERARLFDIIQNREDRLRFMIDFANGNGSILINLAEYLEGIDEHSFGWAGGSEKTLGFSSGNSIMFRRAGEAVYIKSGEFPDILFCIHVEALTHLGKDK
jgi:hypothetical protein